MFTRQKGKEKEKKKTLRSFNPPPPQETVRAEKLLLMTTCYRDPYSDWFSSSCGFCSLK